MLSRALLVNFRINIKKNPPAVPDALISQGTDVSVLDRSRKGRFAAKSTSSFQLSAMKLMD